MPVDNKSPFQNFEDIADPNTVAPRLKRLRTKLQDLELDGFLVPRADAHRGESVPASQARLAWLTGFTGSAGVAVIGAHKAVLLVDGRYTLQAPSQTDTSLFEISEIPKASVTDWLKTNIQSGTIGYDPWLHTTGEIKGLRARLGDDITLKPVANPIDEIWTDRPTPPSGSIEFLSLEQAGKSASDKITELQATIAEKKAQALVLTLPESICWLLNMRGRDVPNTPFVLAFAVVPLSGKVELFVDANKHSPSAKSALKGVANLRDKAEFSHYLKSIANGKTVWLDPATAPSEVSDSLVKSGATLTEKSDPVLALKAQKNTAELTGMRDAHHRDGIALAKFLHWFDREAPKSTLSEIDIVKQLEAFRREDETLVDISFDTISGAGPNGAIVHYRVTEKTNRTLNAGELMLVDSGGQYLSGTTDITRTLFTGSATDEMKDRFTRVLKGMIAVSMARFPKNTSGAQLDTLARHALWDVGLNYAHGTGHGVGAFLSVHEGPIGISPRYTLPLQPGNILSNEPGYYKTDAYGIRIENLVHVIDDAIYPGYLEFETLTLAPIDTRLIDKDLLSPGEIEWLNAYHARVFKEIGPKLESEVQDWLKLATAPI